MAVNTPIEQKTVAEIRENFLEIYANELGVSVDNFPKISAIASIATAVAGLFVLLYRLSNWVYNQFFYETQSLESLNKNPFGIKQKSPVKAKYSAKIIGATATELNAGTVYTFNNVNYQTDALGQNTGGEINVNLIAIEAGAEENPLTSGDQLNIVSTIAGIPSTITIQSVLTIGENEETFEEFKNRIIRRSQLKPQGGAMIDYIIWSIEIASVIDAYVYVPKLGKVDVYPILDGKGANKIPANNAAGNEIINEVSNRIERSEGSDFQDRRPLNVDVEVKRATLTNFEIIITTDAIVSTQLQDQLKDTTIDYFDQRRASIPSVLIENRPINRLDLLTAILTEIKNDTDNIANLKEVTIKNKQTNQEVPDIYNLNQAELVNAEDINFIVS